MPERTPPPEDRAPLFTEAQLRTAFVLAVAGMASVLVLILLLANARPQGAYQPANETQVRTLRAAAERALGSYELVGEDRARVPIERAMELVAERGVDLDLVAIDAPASQAAAPDGGEELPEEAVPAAGAPEGAPDADGQALYAANCASCHQAQGQGVPGAFPPLAEGHMPTLAAADGGRAYLIRAVLFGVQGELEALGQTYTGLMPGWPQLADEEIAAVLNHELTAWNNEASLPDGFEPIAADEVAAARGEALSPADVLGLRPELP